MHEQFQCAPNDLPPNRVTNNESIPSAAAALRFLFLSPRSLPSDDVLASPPLGSSSLYSLLVGTTTTDEGDVAFDLMFLSWSGNDVAVLALPPEKGVAFWRQSPCEEPCMGQTRQTRRMWQQFPGELLQTRSINCQSFGPTHNQEYAKYLKIWVGQHPTACADSDTNAVVDNVRGLCFHRMEGTPRSS